MGASKTLKEYTLGVIFSVLEDHRVNIEDLGRLHRALPRCYLSGWKNNILWTISKILWMDTRILHEVLQLMSVMTFYITYNKLHCGGFTLEEAMK